MTRSDTGDSERSFPNRSQIYDLLDTALDAVPPNYSRHVGDKSI